LPELPEVTLYVEALERRIGGQPLERVRLRSPSLLKTHEPPLAEAEGKRVTAIRRIGKRIVWALDGELFLVFHLMITGRFRWRERGTKVPRRRGHAAFDFPDGTLLLTEEGTKKRASLHVVRGAAALDGFDRGGVEPLEVGAAEFRDALLRENRTLKRALTDPRLVSGVGNAHSDEILLAAGLSPVKRTGQLSDEECDRLYEATRAHLKEWIERLRDEVGAGFPEKVTAFHPAMEVHGRHGEPCPRCGASIQRIVYAENETNYCARCQTEGRLLRDRALSRLLREDWPRTLEDLEELERG
jgi:formamidopyrimidine-DNA glycosylase